MAIVMKKKYFYRMAGVCFSLLLCGCGSSSVKTPQSESAAVSGAASGDEAAMADGRSGAESIAEAMMSPASDAAAVDAVDSAAGQAVLLSADGRYRILLEEGFEDATELFLNDSGSPALDYAIRAAAPAKQAYLLFNAENKEGGVASFEEFQQLLTEAVTGSGLFSDVVLSRPIRITLSGTGFEGTVTSFTAVYHPASTSDGEAAGSVEAADSLPDSSVEGIAEMFANSFGDSSIESAVESAVDGIGGSSTRSAVESAVDGIGGSSTGSAVESAVGSVDTGIPVSVRLYALEGVHSFYQFLCWAPASQEATESLRFDRMVNSLRIMK